MPDTEERKSGYRLEYAKNNRAKCKGPKPCNGTVLDKGTLKIGSIVDFRGHTSFAWRHWGCATVITITNMKRSFTEADELDGFDELRPADQDKIRKAWEDGHVADEDVPGTARKTQDDDGADEEAKPKKKHAPAKKVDEGEPSKPKKARTSKNKSDEEGEAADDDEICMSPILSSAASIFSFDSTFSDTYPSHLQMSPTASESEALELPSAEFEAQHASLPKVSEEGKTPRNKHTTPDNSFIQHHAYFFKDGNVTFLIDGTLYCVHRYFFSRDSVYFSTRFAQLDIRDHEALPTIISLGDVERKDFEALLSVLYPVDFEGHELTYEQWKSVLHLSTHWGFTSLRKLALNSIKPPTPHDQLVLARTYSIDHWVLPALTALCERTLPLNLDEARQMSMEDVILVATVREEIRGGALRVDVADIPRHIKVAQAGERNCPIMGDDIYWGGPKSGTTGQDLDPTTAPGVDPNVEAEIAKTMAVASHSDPRQGTAKEGDTESNVERSSEEVEENRAVGATARPDEEAEVNAATTCRPDAEAAKDSADAEEEASKEHQEAARTIETADAEARKAAAEAKENCEVDLKAKAEAEARAPIWIEERARKKQEEEKKADKKAKKAAQAKINAEAQKAAAAKKAKKAAKKARKARKAAKAKAKANAEAQKAAAAKKANVSNGK